MAEQSDEELVENSRRGDLAAFKTLVIRHEGKIAWLLPISINSGFYAFQERRVESR